MAEVPISSIGRATLDSLARLGFEVAGMREIAGALYAVIVVSPETQGLARPLISAVAATPAADTFHVYQ